jgi:hypothetical protein
MIPAKLNQTKPFFILAKPQKFKQVVDIISQAFPYSLCKEYEKQ